MMIDLSFLYDFALLALRIIVAIVFFSSGKSHLMNPKERGDDIGLSPGLTRFVGISEVVGAISIALGIYIQIGAALLIGTMLGALYKKIFVWGTGFYADKGFGWHYDIIFLCANFLFLATGGSLVLLG